MRQKLYTFGEYEVWIIVQGEDNGDYRPCFHVIKDKEVLTSCGNLNLAVYFAKNLEKTSDLKRVRLC